MVMTDAPIRILTAVPICDGHDSAIITINLELVRHGIEVIYLGYHCPAHAIVRAAIQEDVRAIGISSYNGGHREFFAEVIDLLKQQDARDIGVFGGGGGTITAADEHFMRKKGVDRIFFPGTPLSEIAAFIQDTYAERDPSLSPIPEDSHSDRRTAKLLSAIENEDEGKASAIFALGAESPIPTIGFTGPGGAGKTTLIDELVLRFLKHRPDARIAILCHDPSLSGRGALLGDRASMIYAQDDRVFMRSLASRGRAGGLASATTRCLGVLKRVKPGDRPFDLILVETVGIGQEAVPFEQIPVDKTVLVMGPDYGSRLQLQKIAMFERADLVVINKSDRAGAKTAYVEIEQRLSLNVHKPVTVATIAKQHRDPGVDRLFQLLFQVP
jgi:methylmalonyl-CoA mutase